MSSDEGKTKEQLISKLAEMRQRVSELEALETERKQGAEQWQRSRDFLDHIFNSMFNALMVIDRDYSIIDVNKYFLECYGRSRKQTIGHKCYEITHQVSQPCSRAECLCPFQTVVETGFPFTVEHTHKDKHGEESIVEINSFPLLGPTGEVEYVVEIQQDITERKQVEAALRESGERYRALVNLGGKVGEAIIMLQDTEQGDAIHTFVSDEWPRITGHSRKELLGRSFFDLLHPRYRESSLKRHRRKMRGEIIPGLFEMSVIRKDGTEVPIEVTSAYTTYRGERANVAFIRDITERKQAEEREKRLQQELYLSSRLSSIGELAAGVAHEINNPLTSIVGFSERLLRKSTDEETKRDLERINNEALRAATVVQNLLTFARRHEPNKEYLDINDIVQKALELRAYELKTSNIEVAADLASSLPKAIVDFQQIQEVFLNIILNAEQAMTEAKGGGKLAIKTEKMKNYIRISFTDDGPGIPAKYLGKLFAPFFTTRGEKGGTGLGLSVCHGILEKHGGKIYTESKPGKGATFFVELPLATKKG